MRREKFNKRRALAAPFIRVTTVFSVFHVLVQGKVRPDGFLLDPLTRHEEYLNRTLMSQRNTIISQFSIQRLKMGAWTTILIKERKSKTAS